MTDNRLQHLSPSTVQSYRTCGKQVYFNKILGIDNPIHYAMTAYGSAMHKAIEKLYKEKLDDKGFKKEFIEQWTELSQGVNNWKSDTMESLMTEGIQACEDFYSSVYGKYDISLTEKKFLVDRGDGSLPILCFADAITNDGIIIDYKFGRGLTGTADSKSYACNMATYAWAYQQETGKLPEKIVFVKERWSKSKDKDTGKYVFYHRDFVIDERPVLQETIDFYKDVYDNVEVGIQAGVWLPASDDSFLCNSCGYRIKGLCQKEV